MEQNPSVAKRQQSEPAIQDLAASERATSAPLTAEQEEAVKGGIVVIPIISILIGNSAPPTNPSSR